MTPVFGPVGTLVLLLLALVVSRFAISTARTPQGATGWVVFLLTFPLLALPAYAVLGSVYRINARHASRTPKNKPSDQLVCDARLSDLQAAISSRLTSDNDASLLIDGPMTFEAIFEAIDSAKSEILIQYYMLSDDGLGKRIKSHLKKAKKRGVAVCVLVDAMGSLFLSRQYISELRDAGIDFRGNFRFWRSSYRIGLNFRDHRKTVIVDGRVGFTGGLNASELYIDGGQAFNTWRDTFVRLEGSIVEQLRACFAVSWKAQTDEDLPEIKKTRGKSGEMIAMHVTFGPTDQQQTGLLLLLGLISKARKRLWLTTPYLVPPPEIAAALKLAAKRGVDVRIIVPRAIDKYMPWLASRSYFKDFHFHNISIYEFEPGFMHQKVIVVDDDIASIGTINLDFRSVMLNFEQTALIENKRFCAEMAAMLEDDMALSTRFHGQSQSAWIRWFAPIAQLFSPVL